MALAPVLWFVCGFSPNDEGARFYCTPLTCNSCFCLRMQAFVDKSVARVRLNAANELLVTATGKGSALLRVALPGTSVHNFFRVVVTTQLNPSACQPYNALFSLCVLIGCHMCEVHSHSRVN